MSGSRASKAKWASNVPKAVVMQLAISNDRRSALALFTLLLLCALFAAAASCAHAPPSRFSPPTESRPACSALCDADGAVFLGVLLPTDEGPAICACAKSRPAWGGAT